MVPGKHKNDIQDAYAIAAAFSDSVEHNTVGFLSDSQLEEMEKQLLAECGMDRKTFYNKRIWGRELPSYIEDLQKSKKYQDTTDHIFEEVQRLNTTSRAVDELIKHPKQLSAMKEWSTSLDYWDVRNHYKRDQMRVMSD